MDKDNIKWTLKAERTDVPGSYSVVGLSQETLEQVIYDSPELRKIAQDLAERIGRHGSPAPTDHAGGVSPVSDEDLDLVLAKPPTSGEALAAVEREAFPELIEMIRLQDQLNTAYANLLVAHAGGWRK